MSGVRLHHPTLRAEVGQTLTYVVELPVPYALQRVCPECTVRADRPRVHSNKSVHLRLDHEGNCIVSREALESLRPAFLGGMEILNEVENPPTQVIGAVAQENRLIVEKPLNADHKAADFYVPGHTKYQARDRIVAGFRKAFGHGKEH